MPKPDGVRRVLQRAGMAKPERWRDGFALRLPRRRLLLVVWRSIW